MSTPTTGTQFLGHTGIQPHPIPVCPSRSRGGANGGVTQLTWKSVPPRAVCLIVSREIQASNNPSIRTQSLSSAFSVKAALGPVTVIPSQLPSLLRPKDSFRTPDLGLGMDLIWRNAYLVLILEAPVAFLALHKTGHGSTYLKIQHVRGGACERWNRRVRSPR